MKRKLISLCVIFSVFAVLLVGCSKNSDTGKEDDSNQTNTDITEDYNKEGDTPNGEIFGDTSEIYNYCPSIFYEDENTMYAYYCSNKDSGNVTDYVAYRKGIKVDGEWYWTDKELILSPTEDTWDARHTCDPSVIKGTFRYDNEEYSYLMAYLGCVTSDCTQNEVGIAVAKSPEGPWIKCDEVNPIAEFNKAFYSWGYGQPSVVSVDKAGKVLLFYTAGMPTGTYEIVERWDLSDINNAKKEFSVQVTNQGILKNDGSGRLDIIGNADFAYDPNTGYFYMIADSRPFDSENTPNFISSQSSVTYLKPIDETEVVGDIFNQSNLSWEYLYTIDYSISGYYRNHNCCMIRDAYGWLNAEEGVEAAYTISELNKEDQSLWTYRIHRYKYMED